MMLAPLAPWAKGKAQTAKGSRTGSLLPRPLCALPLLHRFHKDIFEAALGGAEAAHLRAAFSRRLEKRLVDPPVAVRVGEREVIAGAGAHGEDAAANCQRGHE